MKDGDAKKLEQVDGQVHCRAVLSRQKEIVKGLAETDRLIYV